MCLSESFLPLPFLSFFAGHHLLCHVTQALPVAEEKSDSRMPPGQAQRHAVLSPSADTAQRGSLGVDTAAKLPNLGHGAGLARRYVRGLGN